jgi:alpha-beta hydrolase superfamily lysophospholipase
MSAEPLWFGPEERPLFGFLHRPDGGAARGGVLICPPVGIDLSYADGACRRLARTLERAGFVVLRFDYDGTGQSAGSMDDPDRVTAWLTSVEHGIAVLRETGVDWVAGVGLRLGAVLLARTAEETGAFDALVLWDPCASGKSFIREQRALQLAVRPEPGDGAPAGVEIPGYVLTDDAVAGISSLTLPGGDRPPAARVLALLEPTRTSNARLDPLLTLTGVEVVEQHPGPGIYDTGQVRYRPPGEPIDQVAGWLDAVCSEPAQPLSSRLPPAGLAPVARLDDDRAIVEEPLRLGPHGLFGISCELREPDETSASTGPTILLVSIAAESSIGPARQWVELAREWAAIGYRSVRFDLAGIGESPARPNGLEREIYGADGLDDIVAAATALSPDDPGNVVLVGVCSGAYAALTVGPQLRPKGIVAINPLLSFAAFAPDARVPEREANSMDAPNEQPRNLARAILGFRQGSARRSALGDRLPAFAWRGLYALGVSFSPARVLDPLVAAVVATLVVCGTDVARGPSLRAPHAVRRLNAERSSRFEVEPALHHSLLHVPSRAAVRAHVTRFLADVAGERPIRLSLRATQG